jgi:8-oxo-dGTP pyrophosphatase MutT (NUDIX family)
MERVRKVMAYIVRERGGQRELLVFTHRDFPDAGLQVPAGTVAAGEDVGTALLREIYEETGLRIDTEPQFLGTFEYVHPSKNQVHERHLFQVQVGDDLPDAWTWTETDGGRVEESEGYVFCFFWSDLVPMPALMGGQGDYLHALRP